MTFTAGASSRTSQSRITVVPSSLNTYDRQENKQRGCLGSFDGWKEALIPVLHLQCGHRIVQISSLPMFPLPLFVRYATSAIGTPPHHRRHSSVQFALPLDQGQRRAILDDAR